EETAQSIQILYGGSVNPTNARSLFSQPDVDGGLIGGAALTADSFKAIVLATEE
ncbi:MAG: triose-phosphate isomerase, partial [Salibacteraceae bacterium]|nr:triose-phosphate isomerase [Salibacteraceae bacterium]